MIENKRRKRDLVFFSIILIIILFWSFIKGFFDKFLIANFQIEILIL